MNRQHTRAVQKLGRCYSLICGCHLLSVAFLKRARLVLMGWFHSMRNHLSPILVQSSIFVLTLTIVVFIFPVFLSIRGLHALWWIISVQAFISLMHISCELLPLLFAWMHLVCSDRKSACHLVLAFGDDMHYLLRLCSVGHLNSDQIGSLRQLTERYLRVHAQHFNTLQLIIIPSPDGSRHFQCKFSPESSTQIVSNLVRLVFDHRQSSKLSIDAVPIVFEAYFNRNPIASFVRPPVSSLVEFVLSKNLRATTLTCECNNESTSSKRRILFSHSIRNTVLTAGNCGDPLGGMIGLSVTDGPSQSLRVRSLNECEQEIKERVITNVSSGAAPEVDSEQVDDDNSSHTPHTAFNLSEHKGGD